MYIIHELDIGSSKFFAWLICGNAWKAIQDKPFMDLQSEVVL